MSAALLVPCLSSGIGFSWLCCAANTACSLCCSLASCFGCRYNASLAKMTYLFLFGTSMVLSLILRYWGEELLGNVTAIASNAIPNFCSGERCWGMQGAYRVSLGTAIFFAIMVVVTRLAPITHLGGWLVKVFLYAVLVGVSFLINNDNMLQYADAARVFSVIFLLIQVVIIIDFAYNTHDWLSAKIKQREEHFVAENYEPGCCSNGWAVIYVFSSFILVAASLVGLGLQYAYFGQSCPLHNFFISETLVIGILLILVCMMNIIGKGLLPPAILFAYNTYLCYGALTNNPDKDCNSFAVVGGQSEASIYTGLAIAVFSVTWSAYSSAKNMTKAVRMDGTQHSVDNPAATGNAKVKEWPNKGAAFSAEGAARYQNDEEKGDDDDDDETSRRRTAASSSSSTTSTTQSGNPHDDTGVNEDKPWLFHIIMCIAGMYLAMLVTNWGSPDATNVVTGNPELSSASMWARMGSQWVIYLVFVWSLIAPSCFPNYDFTGGAAA